MMSMPFCLRRECSLRTAYHHQFPVRASQNLIGGKLRAVDVWAWSPAERALARASFNCLQKRITT